MVIIFSISPPNSPINKNRYVCDKRFFLDDLKALFEDRPYYALIIMNARDSSFYLANEIEIKKIGQINLSLTNNHTKGGSSAGRFDRLFLNKRDRNDTYQAETILKFYYDYDRNRPKVEGFIIGGSAATRERVFDDPELQVLKDYIVCNIPYSQKEVYPLYEQTGQARQVYEQRKVTSIIQEISELIERNSDRVKFGIYEIMDALRQNLLKKCYVTKKIYEQEVQEYIRGPTEFLLLEDHDLEKWNGCIGICF